ncbi:hypothetical protein HFP72_14615 [Nocardiopsis sp. ARC36]
MTMHRDKRWDLLDRPGDPVPWDTTSAVGLRDYYESVKDAAKDAADDIRRLDRGELGKGETIDALKELIRELPKLLDEAHDSYEKAYNAFDAWETALDEARRRSLTVITDAVASYDALEDKDDWDKDDSAPKHGYVSRLNAVLTDMDEAAGRAADALDDAKRGFGRKLWDFWNSVVEWIEENPLVYAVAMIVAGIAAIFIPGIGFAIALGVFALLTSATQLHRSGKLGLNLETFVTLGIDALSVVPGAVLLRGGGAMAGALGRGGAAVARSRVAGPMATSLRNGATGLRNSRMGLGVSNVVSRSSNTMRAIKEGTFVGPRVSLAADMGIQITRDTAMGTASSIAVNAAAGRDIDLGQELLMGFATNAAGTGAGVMKDHSVFGSGPLLGSGTNGEPSLGINGSGDNPGQGGLAGVDTDFSSLNPPTPDPDGGSAPTPGEPRVSTPEGVTTITGDPSAGTTLDTTTADGSRMSTTVDPSGGITSSSLTSGDPMTSDDFRVGADPVAGTAELTSGAGATSTTVSGDSTVSTGDFGEIRVDRSRADEPSVHYAAPAAGGSGPGFTLDVPRAGEAVVGGSTTVRTDSAALTVSDSGGGVTVTRDESGRSAGLDLTSPDGAPGASYRDGAISVPDGAGGTTVSRDGSGSDISGGGLGVRTPHEPGAPVTVTPTADAPARITVDGNGPEVLLSPDGAGPSVVRDPATGRTASVDGEGHTVGTASGPAHSYRADTGTVRAGGAGGEVAATGSGVSTGRPGGSLPGDSVRLDLSASGHGSATAAGSDATVRPDGTADYRHTATGASAHRTADGHVVAGGVAASPDGTVRGQDFVRRPDGSLTVSDGRGGRHDYAADGTPVPSGDRPPGPRLRTDPVSGHPVFTSQDGTRVPSGTDPVRTGDGMTLRADGGDVTLTMPPNRQGEALRVTHAGDGGVRMDAGGHSVSSGRGGVDASAPDGLSAHRSPDGSHQVSGGGLDTRVSPDGTARTTDTAGGGRTVAEHSGGTGAVHVADGAVVRHGGSGRLDVTRGDGDVTLHDGARDITVSGDRTEVRGNATPGGAGPDWSVGAGPGREIHGGTRPDHRITAQPPSLLSPERLAGRGGDEVSFTAGDGISGHQTAGGRTTVDERSGATISDTRSGVRIDGGEDGPGALLQSDGVRVTSPDGRSHRIDFDGSGRPSEVHVNDGAQGRQTLHADGRAVSEGEHGTVTAEPGGFRHEVGDRTVTADGSGTTLREERNAGAAGPPGSVRPGQDGGTPFVIRHGQDADGGVLGVDREGVSQNFAPDGPTRQGRAPDGPPPVNSTEPTVVRDGDAYRVDTSYQRHSSAPVVDGPTMTRDPSTGESGITTPHGYTATQTRGPDPEAGADTTVRVNDGAPAVTRRGDGTTTVEGEGLRVTGEGDAGSRRYTVDSRTGGPSLTRGPGRDGDTRISDGPDTLVHRDGGGNLTGPDGRPLTPGPDGPRVIQEGFNRIRIDPDGEVRVTGSDGTSVVLHTDGRTSYRGAGGDERVDLNRNGLPTTRVDRDGAHTTVRESGGGTVEVDGTRRDGDATERTRTHLGNDGAVESRISRTGGARDESESWGVGIGPDGRTSTRNYRVRGEDAHRLSADGNLTAGHWGHKDDLGELRAAVRNAEASGDPAAVEAARAALKDFRAKMMDNALAEVRSAVLNGAAGLVTNLVQNGEINPKDLYANLSIVVGAYRGVAENRLRGLPGVPSGGLGLIASRMPMKIGGMEMRNDLRDGLMEEFHPEEYARSQEAEAVKHLEEGRMPPAGQVDPALLARHEHLPEDARIKAILDDLKARQGTA